LLAELMEEAPDSGDLQVLAPPAHADRVSSWLSNNGRAGVGVEGSEAFKDGVAVQDPGRTFRISNTLSGRFALMEQEIRKHCMTTLFGGGAA
jgi:vacuolar-type H+-ATPase subunit E/Vma4